MPILRENIDSKYKWNLEKIYKNNKDFENELENISKKIENIKSYQGKILDSSDNLYNLFEEMNSYDMVLARLYVYAKMRLDEDASKDIYKDYKDRVSYQTFQAMLWGRSYKNLPLYKKKEKKWINI